MINLASRLERAGLQTMCCGGGLGTATIIVFGNDRRVPARWLEKYGQLVADVAFCFLSDSGDLEELH